MNNQNELRLCYNIKYRAFRQNSQEEGRETIHKWYGTLKEMHMYAHGMLAGLCFYGGYKHGIADIYLQDGLNETYVTTIHYN